MLAGNHATNLAASDDNRVEQTSCVSHQKAGWGQPPLACANATTAVGFFRPAIPCTAAVMVHKPKAARFIVPTAASFHRPAFEDATSIFSHSDRPRPDNCSFPLSQHMHCSCKNQVAMPIMNMAATTGASRMSPNTSICAGLWLLFLSTDRLPLPLLLLRPLRAGSLGGSGDSIL